MKYYLDDDEPIQPTKVESKPTSKSTNPSKPEKAEEPGWFQPGSKSEAAVRGFSNAATFGMAPRISAATNSITGGAVGQKLQDYLAADKAAQQANPGTSFAAAAAPMALQAIATGGGSLLRQAGTGAAMGAANAYGNSDAQTATGQVSDAAKGAAIGGTLGAALPLVGRAISKGVGTVSDMVHGVPDQGRIKQAIMNMSKSAEPPLDPTRNIQGQQAVEDAWTKLHPNTMRQQNRINPQTFESLVGNAKDVSKLPPSFISRETMQAAVDVANRGIQKPNLLGSVATGAATGAAGSAIPTYIGTEGNVGATVGSALAGGAAGALGGAKYAMKGNEKIRLPNPEVPDTLGSRLGDKGIGVVRQLGERAIGSEVNAQLNTPTSPFSKLSNYLNPKVQEKEQQVAPILESGSPDEKRKAAMQLQGDASGRAVLNTSSRYRYLED